MKKIFLLLLIIYTANTFSQSYGDTPEGKYDKMADLFNHKKDEEAKKIAEELLSGKYGEIDGYTKFFTLLSVGDYYYQKDDYQKATDFYQQFLDFDKKENPKKIDNKKIYIVEAKGKLEELKPKLALVSTNTSNTGEVTDAAKDEQNKNSETKSVDVNIASENSTIQAVKKETNTDKTVTLTVSGTGKTLEEARLNALRSAIEQAFGAFISSKTEILNDNLVKDEIVSIANGNVQKYDVVSQVEIPNNGYAITLSVSVSISKLTSFAESKGVVIEFKGGVFAQNIKLQKLNEQSEEKAIKNLTEVYLQLLENSFDYGLTSSEPLLVQGLNDVYKINFIIKTVENENYNKFINYFKETLSKLQATDDEATNIIKVGKPIYFLIVDEKVYKFRSINSFHNIGKFFVASQLLSTSFKVTSNLGINKYLFKVVFEEFNFFKGNKLILLDSRVIPEIKDKMIDFNLGNDFDEYNNFYKTTYLARLFPFFIENNTQYKSLSELYNIEIIPLPYWSDRAASGYENIYDKFRDGKMRKYFPGNHDAINIDDTIFFTTNFQKPTFTYDMNLKLTDLERISSFKIEKVPFLEYINNLSNYVELEK